MNIQAKFYHWSEEERMMRSPLASILIVTAAYKVTLQPPSTSLVNTHNIFPYIIIVFKTNQYRKMHVVHLLSILLAFIAAPALSLVLDPPSTNTRTT
jgi:hypothetical protein